MRIVLKSSNMPFKIPIVLPLWMIPEKTLRKHLRCSESIPAIKKILREAKRTHGSMVLVDIESKDNDGVKIVL